MIFKYLDEYNVPVDYTHYGNRDEHGNQYSINDTSPAWRKVEGPAAHPRRPCGKAGKGRIFTPRGVHLGNVG